MITNESLLEKQDRWPLYYAWVTAWIYPANTAQRTAHAAMWKVWLFHVCALLMIAMTIILIVSTVEANAFSVAAIYSELMYGLNELTHDLHTQPYETIAILFFSFAGIELLFFLLAFLTMAWGARDESIKASLYNAQRRVWTCTANILPALIVVASIGIALDQNKSYYDSNITWPTMPTPPTIAQSDPKYATINAEHQAAMDQYNSEMKILIDKYTINYNSQPWYVQQRSFIIAFLSFGAVMWFIWALLRSVGARRDVLPVDRAPLCEFCGYNLTTMPMESRCPECGEPVIHSLGQEVRRGTSWEKQNLLSRRAAWKECFVESILRPKEFGRHLQITTYVTRHRAFLFLHIPIIFLIGFFGLICAYIITEGINSLLHRESIFFIVAIIFGCACVIGTVVVTLFGGWLIGWGHSIKNKRNLMPVSIQAACYLSGYLILWAIFGAVNGLFVYLGYEYRIFQSIRDITGMYVDTIATLCWFVPNVTCGIYYLLLIARTTSGAWYANR